MVYCKPFDPEVTKSFIKLFRFIQQNYPKIQIFVENWLLNEIKHEFIPLAFENLGEQARKEIDCIITLGGDGTILWASK
jgi:NAD kinase